MRDVPPVEQDAARVQPFQPASDAQRGGLAAARRTEQRHELARGEVEGQPVERAHLAEFAAQLDQLHVHAGARRGVGDRRAGLHARRARFIRPTARPAAAALVDVRQQEQEAAARSSAASETATATLASRLPRRLIATCKVSKFNSDEIVNSPSTRATEISAADMIAPMMLGTTIRQMTPNHEQPRLRPASARVTRSIAASPVASAR